MIILLVIDLLRIKGCQAWFSINTLVSRLKEEEQVKETKGEGFEGREVLQNPSGREFQEDRTNQCCHMTSQRVHGEKKIMDLATF